MGMKFINSATDWILIGASSTLFLVEMLAVAGFMPKITNELVEISVYQLWVPVVLGALAGHFFPIPFMRGTGGVKIFVTGLSVTLSAYLLWYITTPEAQVLAVLDILADHLYAFFLGGYLLGSRFFPRPRHPLED
jgi:hypothetical protein